MKWLVSVVSVLVACSAPQRPVPVSVPEAPALTMSATGFGPLSAASPATLVALREVFPGYEVRPVHKDGLEFQVLERDRRLFTVVPAKDGTIFNIHIASGKIAVAGHDGWTVGAKFADWERLSDCACWGGKPVCFRDGEHVAVGFDRSCNGLARSRRGLAGLPIARTIWSPRPFGEEPPRTHDIADEEDDADPTGP
jgi:hypothetical protein